uniref:neugrin-like n=1 Tax=Doryrhamphus excisus TaxID=161450 RepID=UPI0025AE71E3|nr:neugrin-like [Doryrhamphus excisus]
MAGRLPVTAVLATLGARTVAPPSACGRKVPLMFGRFSSGGASKGRMEKDAVRKQFHREEDEGFMMEDVGDQLETLLAQRKKTRKTIKYHMIKRKMMPSGAPERKLTWLAIEQIRYLGQEQPGEWSVQRLAEGFSVSPDVIVRVLKSRFSPDPDRKTQQDARVVLPSGSGGEKSGTKRHGGRSAAVLPPGDPNNGLVPVAAHTLRGDTSPDSKSLAVASSAVAGPTAGWTSGKTKDPPGRTPAGDDTRSNKSNPEEEDGCWRGRVLSEEEMEQWKTDKPPPVVQVGKDFFDGEGGFLYRI